VFILCRIFLEAQKWENRANFLKEHQQKLSIKSAEVLSMKEDIAQRRELLEKKLAEKALLEAKLNQMRQEKSRFFWGGHCYTIT
jgi:hypothetical protein